MGASTIYDVECNDTVKQGTNFEIAVTVSTGGIAYPFYISACLLIPPDYINYIDSDSTIKYTLPVSRYEIPLTIPLVQSNPGTYKLRIIVLNDRDVDDSFYTYVDILEPPNPPDDEDGNSWDQFVDWVEDNPALAVACGAGSIVGLYVGGRLLGGALK